MSSSHYLVAHDVTETGLIVLWRPTPQIVEGDFPLTEGDIQALSDWSVTIPTVAEGSSSIADWDKVRMKSLLFQLSFRDQLAFLA